MAKQYQDSNQEGSIQEISKEISKKDDQNNPNLYQISFYVPVENCEKVKQAMFKAGAGIVGDYQECAWQTSGQGQFRPLEGSDPYLGEVNTLEKVEEFKVEMVCASQHIEKVIQALKSSHPYEMPAFSVIQLLTF